MRTCIRCKEKNIIDNKSICRECMNDWKKMRSSAYSYCEKKIGKMEGDNFEPFKKEMRKLENMWRRNKNKFQSIIEKDVK